MMEAAGSVETLTQLPEWGPQSKKTLTVNTLNLNQKKIKD